MFIFSSHFDLVNKRSVNGFLFRKMVLFVSSFVFSITRCMFYLIRTIRFISKYLFRFQGDDNSQKDDSNSSTPLPPENNQIVSNWSEPEHEPEIIDFEDSEYHGFGEKESPEFCFKFQFQSFQDSSNGESEGFSCPENPPANTSEYQYSSGKDNCGFMDEPEVFSFTVKELNADSNYGFFSTKGSIDGGFLSEKDFLQPSSETEDVHEEMEKKPSSEQKKTESSTFTEEKFHWGKDFFTLDSDPESISISDASSLKNLLLESSSDEFLSERDFGGESEPETLDFEGEKLEMTEEIPSSKETHLQNTSILNREFMDTSERSLSARNPIRDESEVHHRKEKEAEEEIQNSEEPHLHNSSILETDILSEKDSCEDEQEDLGGGETEAMGSLQKFEGPNMQNSLVTRTEDSDELETLWEHQDLIEQLKMELRKVRDSGLPTILEESESPRVMENLKPWIINEKFLHDEDEMDEMHKFYKSYRERMRKFDILNYQKMYVVGFLQLKDPLQSFSRQKSPIPTITTILAKNFRIGKHRRPEVDPMIKFIGELHIDLELVYVGQMCLSWEILRWHYEKTQELQESDPHGIHQYNQVAGEFQQFQVLMQRFLENEAFQGPRVQNYVKNRCVLRNFLQVPAIKEDCLKDKMKGGRRRRRRKGDGVITIAMLTEIIKELMRIFWEFVRADKDEANVILKGHLGTQIELQNPDDSKLLMDLRTNIRKKEKKLKDILRSGNCIVKRLQKHQESRSDHELFFSQVDIKLVSRVLNMSRLTTEQLVWCHKKLSQINFVDRKIHREPSFFLFPC